MPGEPIALPAQPDAVPHARRRVRELLDGAPAAVVEHAQLVVTELVTNALLHGSPPLSLALERTQNGVRVEVTDCGKVLPIRPLTNPDAMTGRGLGLVAAVSSGWGVRPAGEGKAIWAEVSGAGVETAPAEEVDVDELLATWPQDGDPSEPLYTVRLGSVPTALLLAAKSHIDNVVRELELVKADGQRAGEPAVPARLVEVVTGTFASARAQIKRQAVRAAERGEAETELVLTLPASAAEAGEEYLAALDEADRYARSARLLTLESPPLHRLVRRWYVQSLVDQLRAQSQGLPAADPASLLEVLSDEVAEAATLRASWDRLQLLQRITAELTAARTQEEIAAAVIDNAVTSLGALSGRAYLLRANGRLGSIAYRGGVGQWLGRYEEIELDADLPGPEVMRSGEPLFLRSTAEIGQRYPVLEGVFADDRCLHVTPLTVGDHRLGILVLTFPSAGQLDEDTQVSFVRALADALAQALERSLALDREAQARERLSFLADASVALSGSIDYAETVTAVGTLMVPRLADWCVVQVLEGERLKTLGLRHFDPAREAWAASFGERFPTNMDSPSGGPNVLRTGVSEVYPEIPDELVESSAVSPEHLEIIRQLGMRSALVVPLTGRSGTFGAITLIYAESGRVYDPADVPFAEDVARRAALALETAGTFREQSGRLADVTAVAVAAQRAILAAPPPQVGRVALSARYVSAAAEALVGGDLYEIVERPGVVRLLIGDVRGKGLSAVRTATVVLGEFRAAAADLDDLSAAARQIDRRVRPYLGDEDFVTALLAEVHDDGRFVIASCGHPPALLAEAGRVRVLEHTPTLPLGLGADPVAQTGQLATGNRLLLYTDGLVEARNAAGQFLDLLQLTSAFATAPLDQVLDDLLGRLHDQVGPELGDDLALIAAEYLG